MVADGVEGLDDGGVGGDEVDQPPDLLHRLAVLEAGQLVQHREHLASGSHHHTCWQEGTKLGGYLINLLQARRPLDSEGKENICGILLVQSYFLSKIEEPIFNF